MYLGTSSCCNVYGIAGCMHGIAFAIFACKSRYLVATSIVKT